MGSILRTTECTFKHANSRGAFELYALTPQPVLARDDITVEALIPIFGKRKPSEWRAPHKEGFHHLEMTQCAETSPLRRVLRCFRAN